MIGTNTTREVQLQGVFPVNSLINHSCSPNTMCYASTTTTFTCRAVLDIKAGEELTTNYLHYQYHFYGRIYRQAELYKYWYFQCECAQCKDTSAETDSLVCGLCGEGWLSQTWVCSHCGLTKTCQEVERITRQCWDLMEKTSKRDIKELKELLDKTLEVCHKNHYFVLEVKRRMIENIGDFRVTNLEDLGEDWLEKKVELCRDHLAVQTVVSTEPTYLHT